jgi:glutamate synthase domain-containing protein 1
MTESRKALYSSLRTTYSGLLLNGPFSVIIGREGEMIGLTDRMKLRPLAAAAGNSMLYLSSEEAPIRLVDEELERVWSPLGGVPVIGRVGEGICYEDEEA